MFDFKSVFKASENPLPVDVGDDEDGAASFDFSELEVIAKAQQKTEHELTRWEAIKLYPKAFAWSVFMIWVMILVGYENQAGGIVLSIPQFRKDFGHEYAPDEYVLETKWQSAISGGPIAALGFSAFTSSWLGDRFGRKYVIFAALLVTIPSIALEYVSTTINVFFAGKFLNALCLGVFHTLCISYVSEVSPLALRGFVSAGCALSQTIGPFVCYLINRTTATYTTRMAYRGVFIPQWVFSVSCILIAPFMPESPYYYITKGKNEHAMKSLKKLFTPEQAHQQYAIMKVTYEELKLISQSRTYADCFKPKDIRRTLIVMFTLGMQSLAGVNFASSYSTYFFQLAGFSTVRSYQLSCGGQSLSVAGVISSWFIIDRFGRRPLIFVGMGGLCLINLLVGAIGTQTSNPQAMTAASAFLVMYNYFYNIGVGPLPYILAAEVSSISLRAKTFSFASILNYCFQCMWSFVLPYMFNPDRANMGSKITFIFFGCIFLSLFVFYFHLPETKGRSFEEIDEMFDKKVPARKWRHYVTEKQHATEKIFETLKDDQVSHHEYVSDEEAA